MRKITTRVPINAKFISNAPNNFVVCWNGFTFGVANGQVFNSAKFTTKEDELNWLNAELLFIAGITERIKMYKDWRINTK